MHGSRTIGHLQPYYTAYKDSILHAVQVTCKPTAHLQLEMQSSVYPQATSNITIHTWSSYFNAQVYFDTKGLISLLKSTSGLRYISMPIALMFEPQVSKCSHQATMFGGQMFP